MEPSGHFYSFYSYVDPEWSSLIIGTGCVLGRAPRTRRLYPIFMSGVGLPDVHE